MAYPQSGGSPTPHGGSATVLVPSTPANGPKRPHLQSGSSRVGRVTAAGLAQWRRAPKVSKSKSRSKGRSSSLGMGMQGTPARKTRSSSHRSIGRSSTPKSNYPAGGDSSSSMEWIDPDATRLPIEGREPSFERFDSDPTVETIEEVDPMPSFSWETTSQLSSQSSDNEASAFYDYVDTLVPLRGLTSSNCPSSVARESSSKRGKVDTESASTRHLQADETLSTAAPGHSHARLDESFAPTARTPTSKASSRGAASLMPAKRSSPAWSSQTWTAQRPTHITPTISTERGATNRVATPRPRSSWISSSLPGCLQAFSQGGSDDEWEKRLASSPASDYGSGQSSNGVGRAQRLPGPGSPLLISKDILPDVFVNDLASPPSDCTVNVLAMPEEADPLPAGPRKRQEAIPLASKMTDPFWSSYKCPSSSQVLGNARPKRSPTIELDHDRYDPPHWDEEEPAVDPYGFFAVEELVKGFRPQPFRPSSESGTPPPSAPHSPISFPPTPERHQFSAPPSKPSRSSKQHKRRKVWRGETVLARMEGKLPPREPTAPPSSDEESSTESVREPWSYQNIVESTMSEDRRRARQARISHHKDIDNDFQLHVEIEW